MREGELLYFTQAELEWMLELSGGPEYSVYSTEKPDIREEDMARTLASLYRRGFVREGYKALQSLADTALDFETSRIYPGIPEYFSLDGRGRYHYLTGAGSWYMLTMITEVFGVRGELGDLVIAPKLLKKQFDSSGKAELDLMFAQRQLHLTYIHLTNRDCGEYLIKNACLISTGIAGMRPLPLTDGRLVIARETLQALPETGNGIIVELM